MGTPKNLISIKEFKEGKEHYKKHFSEVDPQKYTRSVWFSLENLKEYIKYIEEKSAEKGISVSGISFNFMSNDEQPIKLNLALCPTTETLNSKGITEHTPFDPIRSEKEKPMKLATLVNDSTKSIDLESLDSTILNRGYLCPDICPEEEF